MQVVKLVQQCCVIFSGQGPSLTVQCVGVALNVPAFQKAPHGHRGVGVDHYCLRQVH